MPTLNCLCSTLICPTSLVSTTYTIGDLGASLNYYVTTSSTICSLTDF